MRQHRRDLLVAAAIGLAACGGCARDGEPARPREVNLVEEALRSTARYEETVAELEKTPKQSLRAVQQAGATPGTRRAMLLRILEDRLKRPGTYSSWLAKVRAAASGPERQIGPTYAKGVEGLDGRDQTLFWAERLLVDGRDTTQVLSAGKLRTIGGDVARHALGLNVQETDGAAALGLRSSAEALAALGAGTELADGLAAWRRAERPESLRTRAQALLRGSLAMLSPADTRRTSDTLLKALAGQPLDDAKRRGYLEALTVVAGPGDLDQLAALRRAPWAPPLKGEIDAAIAAALARQGPAAKPGGVVR